MCVTLDYARPAKGLVAVSDDVTSPVAMHCISRQNSTVNIMIMIKQGEQKGAVGGLRKVIETSNFQDFFLRFIAIQRY